MESGVGWWWWWKTENFFFGQSVIDSLTNTKTKEKRREIRAEKMESEQMLPIYKKPLVKEKAKWKRSACLTFAGLTFLVTVVFGSILFFVNKNRNDEPLSINDDLNVSVSVDDDNFFSFNSLLNGI